MTSESKHEKRSKTLPARLDEDRFSNLPNCLIVKIISLLPTKDVVATSALSKKLKRFWISVTSLDFDDNLIWTSSAESFAIFVDRVLLLHDKSCLQRFSFKGERIYDGSRINAWISSVLLCNMQEFNLCVLRGQPVLLPLDLFLCKSLVVLKVHAKIEVELPTSICLPSLKTLQLDTIELSDDASIVSLLSGCPVLEELILILYIRKDVHIINIISPALKSLTVEFCRYHYWEAASEYKHQIVIDTPALKYLNFKDYLAESYVFKNLNDLIKAEIDIINPRTDFLVGISQVRSLVLSYDTMETLFSRPSPLPTFGNLTYLEIYGVYMYMLPEILANFPCLETLYIHQEFPDGSLLRVDDVPPCLFSHLKVIKIDIVDYELGMEMVEYFLENAKVLEKLTIDFREDNKVDATVLKQLLMLPRGSATCKVEVL